MDRKTVIKHNDSEVLVVFDDNGTLRNELLRDVPGLAARLAAHETSAVERRQELEAVIKTERATIDDDVFAVAEQEIEARAERLKAAKEQAGEALSDGK